MRDFTKLGGQAAQATRQTMPSHIWTHEVEMAAIGEGVDADFLRSVAVRKALHRAYVHDEPVYMIAHELIQLWQAEVVIRRERVFDSDRRVIRDAHRSQRQWRLR